MRKAFRFRLETVQRVRSQAVGQQRRAVADAVRAVTSAETDLTHVTNQLRDLALLTRDAKQTTRLDVASLRSHQFRRGWLADRAIKTQSDLTVRRAALKRERDTLGDVSKRLKVIEKLREREWQRFRTEQAKQEQTELDEVALQQFVRRIRVGVDS